MFLNIPLTLCSDINLRVIVRYVTRYVPVPFHSTLNFSHAQARIFSSELCREVSRLLISPPARKLSNVHWHIGGLIFRISPTLFVLFQTKFTCFWIPSLTLGGICRCSYTPSEFCVILCIPCLHLYFVARVTCFYSC